MKPQQQPAPQVSDILNAETIEAVHKHIVCEDTLEDREWNQISKRAINHAHEGYKQLNLNMVGRDFQSVAMLENFGK